MVDGRAVTFKLQAVTGPGHVRVLVYAGADLEHLALCGPLTFRPEEWEEFRRQITRGPLNRRRQFVLEERDVAEPPPRRREGRHVSRPCSAGDCDDCGDRLCEHDCSHEGRRRWFEQLGIDGGLT